MDNALGFSVGMFQAENRIFFSSKDIVDTSFRLSRESLWPVPKRTQGTKLSVTIANAEKKWEEKWAMLSAENTDTTNKSARRVKLSMIAGEVTMFPLICQTT